MAYISFLISHVPPAHSFFQKKSILINPTQNLVQLIFLVKCKKITCITLNLQYIDVLGDSILSIDATYFFQHYLRALSAKNANHLQTTDTIKRHQRYSIHDHRG